MESYGDTASAVTDPMRQIKYTACYVTYQVIFCTNAGDTQSQTNTRKLRGGGESEETIVSIKSVGADYFVGQQVPPYEQLLLANTVFNIQRR